MKETIKCPVRWVYKNLEDLKEKVLLSKDFYWIEEIKSVVLKISKGIGTKKTLELLFKQIGEAIECVSVEIRSELKFIKSFVKENIEVFENHLILKSCFFEECDLLVPPPCQIACPADIDIPTFISLISQKRYKEAIEVIRKDNPFPWICGLICTHPCEKACVRGKIDEPVSIMNLKSFVAEMCLSQNMYINPKKLPDNGKKVCVIGGGPAGLTCAYYLSLWGYKVTIIEALPVMGGMMRVGIPAYRLPREVIDKEINLIKELGVEFRLNTRFGKDVTFDSLKSEGFQAFMIAIGAHDCYRLNIDGEDKYSQVFSAVDFLRDVNLGKMDKPGDRVVIVGGGNVAIDAARTCVRLGCKEVIIAYRRSEDQMPADPEEIHEAKEEGVKFMFLTIPRKIIGEEGNLTGMVCVKAELKGKDASGRPRPVPIEGSEFTIEADAVIAAIGQKVDKSCVEEIVCSPCELDNREEDVRKLSSLEWTDRNTIKIINPATMQTNLKGVFASGDVVLGPATVVEAIGQGKRAAYGIHRYLSGIYDTKYPPFPARRGREGFVYISSEEKENLKRVKESFLPLKRRKTTFQQVHLGFGEEEGVLEAQRCLRCDVCIRCGRCVEVCRYEVGVNALHLGYIYGSDTSLSITQDLCIGCGACARNCPTGAMRVEDHGGYRILSICGTVLSKLPLVFCKECGKAIGTERYLKHMESKLEKGEKSKYYGELCYICARKKVAENESLVF